MSTENPNPAATLPTVPYELIPSDLAAAAARATEYVRASKSEATRRAYRSDLEGFRTWCEGKRLNALPAFPETIALYIADLAATHKPSSIGRKLAAISVAHKTAGHPPRSRSSRCGPPGREYVGLSVLRSRRKPR